MFAKALSLLIVGAPFALGLSMPALGVDLRVLQLENEVKRLQREVEAQSRRIAELEQAANIRRSQQAPINIKERADSSPAWLIHTNWERLRPGMKVVDVIALLGRPTSVRTDEEGRISSLWYAMELGPTAVISGNVRFDDASVTEINKPVLR